MIVRGVKSKVNEGGGGRGGREVVVTSSDNSTTCCTTVKGQRTRVLLAWLQMKKFSFSNLAKDIVNNQYLFLFLRYRHRFESVFFFRSHFNNEGFDFRKAVIVGACFAVINKWHTVRQGVETEKITNNDNTKKKKSTWHFISSMVKFAEFTYYC